VGELEPAQTELQYGMDCIKRTLVREIIHFAQDLVYKIELKDGICVKITLFPIIEINIARDFQ